MNMDYWIPSNIIETIIRVWKHNLITEWIILVFRIEKKNFEYVDAVNHTRHERNVDLENNFGLGHFSPPLKITPHQGYLVSGQNVRNRPGSKDLHWFL